MYNVKYSNQAEIDLHDAIAYIAEESVMLALEYLKSYEKKVELLQLNPLMGVECNTKGIKKECRVIVYKSHIVIYRVNNIMNEIFIIRIYHHSENYVKTF